MPAIRVLNPIGVIDNGDPSDLPDGALSWARQADFSYPGQMRISPGMTRHVTTSATNFITTRTSVGDERPLNIFAHVQDGETRLLCLKHHDVSGATTVACLWDMTVGSAVTQVIADLKTEAGGPLGTTVPWPVVQFKDETFIVNGQSPLDATGSNYLYGIALTRSGGAWSVSDIGVAYSTAKTTQAPTAALTTANTVLEASAQYGFRCVGYDTSKGAYGDLCQRDNVQAVDMQVWQATDGTKQSVDLTLIHSATDLGVDEIRVFRTLANGADFYYESAVTSSTKRFTTTMPDGQLANQERYEPGGPPPDTFYLIEKHGQRMVGIGTGDPNRLYYSGLNPHEWHAKDYRGLPSQGRPVALVSMHPVLLIHYDTGIIVSVVGDDAKTGRVRVECGESTGAVSQAAVARYTSYCVYVGRDGIYMYTGQACPQKISMAIDGFWEEALTKASLTEAVGMRYKRGRRNEFWALFPEDNLLVRVPLGEGIPDGRGIVIDRCHATAMGWQITGGEMRAYIGAEYGAVFRMDDTGAWGTSAQLVSAPLGTSATTYTTVGSATSASLGSLGMPIVATSGRAEGQVRWVKQYDATGTQLSYNAAFDSGTQPQAGDGAVVGGLPFDVYTKWYGAEGYSAGRLKRWMFLTLLFEDDANANDRSGLLDVYAAVHDYVHTSPRAATANWELIGQIDFAYPDPAPIRIDLRGRYLALRFYSHANYQHARTINGWEIEFRTTSARGR